MFDYSNLTKKDLVSDVESTFKKSSTLILEIKNSEIPEIMMFDSFERIIEDLSGRVAFLADVSDSEEIRNYGNEVESLIGNYLIEIFTDVDLFNKFNLNLSPSIGSPERHIAFITSSVINSLLKGESHLPIASTVLSLLLLKAIFKFS